MKLCEANALAVQIIEVGSFDDRIAVGCDIAIALIVCEHENDVWPLGSLCG